MAGVFPNGFRVEDTPRIVPPLHPKEQKWESWSPQNLVAPIRFRSEDVIRTTPSFPAAQQQWTGLSLSPTNSTLGGWWGLDDVIVDVCSVIYQQTSLVPFAATSFEDAFSFELDFVFVPPFPMARHRWDSWSPESIVSAPAEGWRAALDLKFAPPLNATAQRWETFGPQGAIPTFQSAIPVSDGGVVFADQITIGQFSSSLNAPPAVTLVDGWRAQFDPRFASPLAASQQRWESFGPAGTILAGVFPNGWLRDLDRSSIKPFAAPEQQWAPWEPQGVALVYPDGWRGYEADEFAKPFNAAQQRWDVWPPQSVVAPTTSLVGSVGSQGIVLFTRPVIAGNQPVIVAPVSSPSSVVEGWRGTDDLVFHDNYLIYQQTSLLPYTPSSFNNAWSFELDYALKSPLPAARQQWDAWPAEKVTGTVTTFVEGWRGFETDAFSRPYPAAEQRWESFEPAGTILAGVFPNGFLRDLDARAMRPLAAAEQQWTGLQLIGPTFTSPNGWWGLDDVIVDVTSIIYQQTSLVPFAAPSFNNAYSFELDFKFIPPFPVAQQQGFVPALNLPPTFFVEGWRGLQLDAEIIKPFPVAQQQGFTPPLNLPPIFIPEGWRGLQLDAQIVKPFASAQQQWAAWSPQQLLRGIGYRLDEFDYAFKARFPVVAQLFASPMPPEVLIAGVFPNGWLRDIDEALKKPFPAALQQYLAFIQPVTQVSNFRTWFGSPPLDTRFDQPFPAPLQSWASWPPELIVSPTAVGGAGKRIITRQYPEPAAYNVPPAPHKPIRPVWDKPEPPPPAPTAPKVAKLPPLTIFSGSAQQTPLDTKTLPTFGQYTIPRVLSLADRLKQAKIQFMQDDDDEALKLLLEGDEGSEE